MSLDLITLRKTLRESYKSKTWIGASNEPGLLRQILPLTQADFRVTPHAIEFAGDVARKILQLGVITLADGKRLGIFEVELNDTSTKIARNRVGLRDLARRLIDEATVHGALAFYFHPSVGEYRFSFISRQSRIEADGTISAIETHPKRFTYVLGKSESCTTAAQRFLKLAVKPSATLGDLIDAFSVEKLSDEFFTEYKERYLEFCRHLGGLNELVRRRAFGDDEKQDKRLRDFVKKLLGRLVFLHFLQRKGWLGAPSARTDWTGGDPVFFLSFFGSFSKPEKFYSTGLAVLFFDTLNTRRLGDLFALTGTRVPYLNGGLFDDDPVPTTKLDFPPALFQDLFDFFGRYNFTIDENSPDDHEIGIDPEMLSRIFENLLEENKEKGAYYTRREVVHYMCQQSLYRYLRGQLLADSVPDSAPEAEALRRLVYTYELGEPATPQGKYLRQYAKAIEAAIDRVKICDPAIGSGAFPIGLLQVIFTIKSTLDLTLDRAQAKRDLIQNCIHGVDLDSGAVDIARLRFWLSLVVDEDAPTPLPNLDYKIMQGNSLLEWFEGIALDELTGAKPRATLPGQMSLLTAPGDTADLGSAPSESESAQFTKLLRSYFSIEGKDKKNALHAKIDQRVLQFIDDRIAEVRESLEIQKHQHEADLARMIRGLRTKAQQEEFIAKDARAKRSRQRVAELGAEIAANEERRTRLRELQDTAERPFFLWHFFFQDVFAQGGFDIVIANPPYVRADHPSQVAQRAAILATGKFQTLWEKWDLFVAFVEQSFHLLKPGGIMAQIVSDGYCHAKYAQKSQNWFLQHARIVRLDFVSDLKLFDAGVRNIIFFVEKANGTHWRPERRLHLERSDRLPEEPMIGHVKLLPTDEQRNLTHRTFFPEDAVAKTFSAATQPLEAICYISVGIVAHADEKRAKGEFELADLVSETRDSKHPKKFVEGKHLGKWTPRTHKWLEWGTKRAPELFRRPTFPELYDVPDKLFILRVAGDDLKICYDDGQLVTNHTTVIAVPWQSLKGVLNRSIRKSARYASEPQSDELPSREDCEKTSQRYATKFLLACLNSSQAREFLRANRRSNTDLYPDDWKQLPIPDVTPEQQAPIVALVDKILAAKRPKPDADVSVLEAEVDRLVTALYGIGETQGAPPVRVDRATADTKSVLRDHILAELGRRSPYISLQAIRAELKARKLAVETETLQRYLHEFVETGSLYDAGRGWYSTLAKPLTLDRTHVAPVVDLVEKAFPLLAFAAWSTQQINPWIHHLLGKFVTFVYVEKEGLNAVWELLRDSGYDAYRDPGKREAKNFSVREQTVVVRVGGLSQAPIDGRYAAPEKVLVDLVDESRVLPLMDASEIAGVFSGAIRSGRINMSDMLKYSSRKRIEDSILKLLNPVLSQNDVL
ncbi:MAG TPA: DUF6577 family protein [Lacunisphaera sp.]|jgi:hypothetical protein